jgi:hypothetical protein
MADALRRLLYPAFVATIFATLWAMGYANALAEQAYNRRSIPPENPELFHFVDDAADTDATASLAPDDL